MNEEIKGWMKPIKDRKYPRFIVGPFEGPNRAERRRQATQFRHVVGKAGLRAVGRSRAKPVSYSASRYRKNAPVFKNS